MKRRSIFAAMLLLGIASVTVWAVTLRSWRGVRIEPRSPGALPAFRLEMSGSHPLGPARDRVTLSSDDMLSIALRPVEAYVGDLEVHAFVDSGAGPVRWPLGFERLSAGTLVFKGPVGAMPLQFLPGVTAHVTFLLARSGEAPADLTAARAGPASLSWTLVDGEILLETRG